jgi:hypothetical protein
LEREDGLPRVLGAGEEERKKERMRKTARSSSKMRNLQNFFPSGASRVQSVKRDEGGKRRRRERVCVCVCERERERERESVLYPVQ